VSLRELAAGIDRAGQALTSAGVQLAELVPPAAAFGAGAPGALGELGRDMHGLAVAALAARSREAAAHGARLSDTAQLLRRAGAGYAEADDTARRRSGGSA
jgi:hypothetical protein